MHPGNKGSYSLRAAPPYWPQIGVHATKQSHHHGLGFIINPRLFDHFLSITYISVHIAVIDLCVPMRNGSNTKGRIVNVYGPTS